VRAALRASVKQDKPVYIRMGKKGERVIHDGVPADFEIGKALTIREGSDVCLLSTGNMLPEAMDAADAMAEKGISAAVISFHTVKPLDETFLSEAFGKYRKLVTLEEHSLIGGFGSAVAEWAVDNGADTSRLMRVAAPDAFFKKAGHQDYAREQLGLDAATICKRVTDSLA